MNFKEQQAQAHKPDIADLKKKLDLKEEEWDAISFFKSGINKTYIFNIIRFKPKDGNPCVREVTDLGHKYYILSTDETGIYKEEAILGDPIYILLNNYIKGGVEGFMVKKSREGTDMVTNILAEAKAITKVFSTLLKGNTATTV